MMDYRSTQDEVVCLWVTVLVILTDVGRSTLKVGGTSPQAGGPRLYKDGKLAEGEQCAMLPSFFALDLGGN